MRGVMRLLALALVLGAGGCRRAPAEQAVACSRTVVAVAREGAVCISGRFADPSAPDCVVEEVRGGRAVAQLPRCGLGVPAPCWRIDVDPACGRDPALLIDRAGTPAPPHTVARVSCAVSC